MTGIVVQFPMESAILAYVQVNKPGLQKTQTGDFWTTFMLTFALQKPVKRVPDC